MTVQAFNVFNGGFTGKEDSGEKAFVFVILTYEKLLAQYNSKV
jgi:hypothetical protein